VARVLDRPEERDCENRVLVSSGCFAVKDTLLRGMWPTLSCDRPEESRALGSFAVTMIAWRVFLTGPKEKLREPGSGLFWVFCCEGPAELQCRTRILLSALFLVLYISAGVCNNNERRFCWVHTTRQVF